MYSRPEGQRFHNPESKSEPLIWTSQIWKGCAGRVRCRNPSAIVAIMSKFNDFLQRRQPERRRRYRSAYQHRISSRGIFYRARPHELRRPFATSRKKGKFLLAEDGPSLTASIYFELRGEHGYFGMLSVVPARQKMGAGRQLVAEAERYFRDAGCKFSDLKIVNVRTELQALYRRLGYIETGTAVYDDPVPTKMPVHFIAMSKPLL